MSGDREGILQDAIDLFLVSRLRADAAVSAAVGGRIFPDIAPAVDPATGAPPLMPYVIYSRIAAGHNRGGWGEVLAGVGTRTVKAVGRGSYGATRAAKRGLYAALHKAEGEVTVADADNARVFVTCHVEEARRFLDPTSGEAFVHDGWVFRFTASLIP